MLQRAMVAAVLASLAVPVGAAEGESPAVTEVTIVARATKIVQLIGDTDRQRGAPTANQTETRYALFGTDLGIPFVHGGRTYVLFGDTVGAGRRNGDSIAVTDDTTPEEVEWAIDFYQKMGFTQAGSCQALWMYQGHDHD